MPIDLGQAGVGVEVEADVHERPPCNWLNSIIALREDRRKRCLRLRRLTGHTAPYRTPRLASLFLVMRSPDILILMRIANDIATCMYYTGLDPFTGQEVYVARHLRDRKLQRALLQFFKPEICLGWLVKTLDALLPGENRRVKLTRQARAKGCSHVPVRSR